MRYSGIAQLVEHLTVNQVVVSSSLTAGVDSETGKIISFQFFLCSENENNFIKLVIE